MYYLYEMVGSWVQEKHIWRGQYSTHAPKVKKKYVVTLKIFVVFILDEIVY